jgi:hypothetical protein
LELVVQLVAEPQILAPVQILYLAQSLLLVVEVEVAIPTLLKLVVQVVEEVLTARVTLEIPLRHSHHRVTLVEMVETLELLLVVEVELVVLA